MKDDGSEEKSERYSQHLNCMNKWVNTVPKVMIKFMIVKMT